MSRLRAPIRRKGGGYVVDLGADETTLVRRLIGELRALLTDPDDGAEPLLARLFPVAHPDDPDMEAEYQRLMRDELVESKLAALATVDEVLAGDGRVDEGGLLAFMQSVNSIRLVLGTMLDVGEDDDVTTGLQDSPEYHLYGYLSWLLDTSVRAVSGG